MPAAPRHVALAELGERTLHMEGAHGSWPHDAAGSWFVMRTRSRQEQILARDLRDRRVAHFLPLVTVLKCYAGREAAVQTPLFPGYLFLRGNLDDVSAADRTDRVAQIIPVPDQPQLERDLHHLHRALTGGQAMNPHPSPRPGVRVEVREGPLRGLQGMIESPDRRGRIILQVQALGQAVSLEVDPALVHVLE